MKLVSPRLIFNVSLGLMLCIATAPPFDEHGARVLDRYLEKVRDYGAIFGLDYKRDDGSGAVLAVKAKLRAIYWDAIESCNGDTERERAMFGRKTCFVPVVNPFTLPDPRRTEFDQKGELVRVLLVMSVFLFLLTICCSS